MRRAVTAAGRGVRCGMVGGARGFFMMKQYTPNGVRMSYDAVRGVLG